MSRLSDAVARGALVAYLMGGDPDAKRGLEYARAVLREADVLELGVPFSDPVADGPTIQKAGVRALQAGSRLADVLATARTLRSEFPEKPLVLMTYYNPVFIRGVTQFARDVADAGVDGVILPDVPLEESADAERAFRDAGLDLVHLATPATPPARLERLANASRGFLYLVSSFGVTGATGTINERALEFARSAKAAVRDRVPVAVGFGVSTPADVRALRDAGVDGVIVGSAIVRLVEEGQSPEEVAAFVRALREGV